MENKGITIEALKEEWEKEERKENAFKEKWGAILHWCKYKFPWWIRWGIKMKIEDAIRSTKFAYQRVVRGYDDRWLWGLYYENTKQNLEVLRWMRKNRMGSFWVTDEDNVLKTKSKYDKKDKHKFHDLNVHKRCDEALDIMIQGFEAFEAMEDVHLLDKKGQYDHKATMKEKDRLYAIFKKGMKLYVNNYRGLWD